MFRRILLSISLVSVVAVQPASAQAVLDRTVGPDPFGRPLEFRAFTSFDIGAFAQAAHVPIGFEALAEPPNPAALPAVVLTGRTVRDALSAMLAVDRRYHWREDDGVILFEPAGTSAIAGATGIADGLDHPLEAPAPAIRIGETTARAAFAIVAALLGAPRSTAIGVTDTKPFVLDAPEGTVRALLNTIVRSHGEIVWRFDVAGRTAPPFPYTLSFIAASGGFGIGLSGRATEPLDLRSFTSPTRAAASPLEATVGPRSDGRPLVLTGMWLSAARDLSAASSVPFGMQAAPRRATPAHDGEFTATGRTLREVLDVIVARDPRYEWRVVEGTIVIRPARAWGDAQDPLFALAPDVDLHDASMTKAVRAIASALGGGDQRFTTFPDTRTVSLSVVHGTGLDLLTALVRAHGALNWTLEDAEPGEIQATGLRHRLTLYSPGGTGLGLLVR